MNVAHRCSHPDNGPRSVEFKIEKNRLLTLDSLDANQRSNFKEPRILHLHIHRKALKSLT